MKHMLSYNITETVAKYHRFPVIANKWGNAGDGNSPGNMKPIGIKICVNSDVDFKKAVENTAWLTKHLMDTLKIPYPK